MREEAITRIKRAVALEKLGEAEGIEVSDEDVEERIESIIEENREQYPDATEEPEITDDVRSSIRRLMHSERVMERLMAIAKGEAPELAESAEEAEPEEAESTDDAAEAESAEAESKEE